MPPATSCWAAPALAHMASAVLVLSLACGLGIGYLLPEEATRWDAVKLAFSVGLCVAMLLLTYEHHFGTAQAAAQREPASTAAARPPGGSPPETTHAGAQTDDVAGLVPLCELLVRGAPVGGSAQATQPKRRAKKAAETGGDGAQFFVD